ncbi:MAG: MBL fold metallo-hydrolase [Bacilli bacterium]
MRACVLSSGSKGNVTYVETTHYKLLLDAGRNYKYIKDSLGEIGVLPEEIDYILISHTHKDHISALKTFINKNNVTLIITEAMLLELDDIKDYPHILVCSDEILLDDLVIKIIPSSHDSIDSRNFIITSDNKSLAYITDTGYLNKKYFKYLENLDIYLFESNHDIELLQHGPYPAWLKKRVLSDEGHLSNKLSSFYLAKLIGDNTKKIILIHLSETNNLEEIALETLKNTFIEYGIKFNDIECAKQEKRTDVVEI